jgi:hypothetical protein
VRADGAASLSWAEASSEIDAPTVTSSGDADKASIIGQMLTAPETSTLPVRTVSWHSTGTVTLVVLPADTATPPTLPAQTTDPSVAFPLSEMVYGPPAGSDVRNEIFVL